MVNEKPKQKAYFKCPKCGKDAFKLYSLEEINKEKDAYVHFNMSRQYQCIDKENCAYVFEPTLKQILSAFKKKCKDEGKTTPEIISELIKGTIEEHTKYTKKSEA